MVALFRNMWRDEQAQDIAEYALMLAVIAALVIAAVTLIGTQANVVFGKISTALGA
jgi:pilus assembly protein Flp/PilA